MKDYKKTYHIVKSNIDNSYILLCELERKKSIGFYQVFRGSKAECIERKELIENEERNNK